MAGRNDRVNTGNIKTSRFTHIIRPCGGSIFIRAVVDVNQQIAIDEYGKKWHFNMIGRLNRI